MKKSPILWTSLEAAVITGGKNTQEWQATGLCLNENEVMPGDLFFAAQNDDLEKVFQRGAVAAVVPWNAADREGRPMLKVPDVFAALMELARASRYKTHAEVIAVQGTAARKTVQSMLSVFYQVHYGGRHLSQGLASMPETADFAVFGFSPLSKPDIAIVTDCSNVDGSVFESMLPSGRIFIFSDEGDAADVIAKARAAGIRNIFTFGSARDADAVMFNTLVAANGTRVQLKILDEIFESVVPPGETVAPVMTAVALILKLAGNPAHHIARVLSGSAQKKSFGESGKITLIDRFLANQAQTAFRVVNMIDTGGGRRTAVLDNISAHYGHGISISDKNLEIPRRIDTLNLVFACKRLHLLSNAETAIRESQSMRSLGRIVPDVLAPGDFLTFKRVLSGPKNMIANALRNISPSIKKSMKADHAL